VVVKINMAFKGMAPKRYQGTNSKIILFKFDSLKPIILGISIY